MLTRTLLTTLLLAFTFIGLPSLAASSYYYSTSGCNTTGFTLDPNGHLNRSLPSGRTYLLHVPSTYNNGIAHPLVLSFHGAGDTSAQQEKLSQFSDPGMQIAGLPIIAAYPQGAPNTAQNRSATWASAPYANTSVDDVQFVKDVISDLSSAFCINPARVYASGKSNGAGFVNLLACLPSTSSLFAAFAPVSPALYPQSLSFSGCNPSRPIPLISSHGLEDQTIPFNGRNDTNGSYGTGTATINVPLWRAQWAARNGCYQSENGTLPAPTVTRNPYSNTTEYIWECQAEVRAFTVANLGHSWPTTQGLDASGAPNNTASFNITYPQMIDFFSKITLPVWYLNR